MDALLWMVTCLVVGVGVGLVGIAAGQWAADRFGHGLVVGAAVLAVVGLAASLAVFG